MVRRLTSSTWSRTVWGAIALGLGVAAIARPLLAADVSGIWTLQCQVGEERQTIRLDLEQDRPEVMGEGVVRRGVDEAPVRVSGGIVAGADFRLPVFIGANRGLLVGAWYRDEMSGRADGAVGSCVFQGTRVAPQP